MSLETPAAAPVEPGPRPAPASRGSGRARTVGWWLVAGTALVYAPMAFEYMFRFVGDGPRLWQRAYEAVVGETQAAGVGSVHTEQAGTYADLRWLLLGHTAVGALALAIAVFQITARSRATPGLHRTLGRVQVGMVVVSMSGALAYLAAAGPSDTFDGPPFFAQLVVLAGGTLAATLLGWLAMRRRWLASHRTLMLLAFALLCTAPALRVEYLVLGLAWPDVTQEVVNLAGGAVLGVLAPIAAMVGAGPVRVPRASASAPAVPEALLRVAVPLLVTGLAAVAVGHLLVGLDVDRVTLTTLVALAVGLTVVAVQARAARQGGDPRLAAEWDVHLVAACAVPAVVAVLWLAYAPLMTTHEALGAALLTGPALPLATAVVLVAWTRRPVRAAVEVSAAGR
ncbi:DUF2306 domain-containing protein [Nocardioides sp.]|uniref:DUF2306 domain-containing protein n=1 Tax=Nocardioides sp. TaxID=35761 RepID=UPI00351591B1